VRHFYLMTVAAVLGFAGPSFAAEEITGKELSRIHALLADIKCQIDDDDIEKTQTGYELDDVFCAEGQFDIELNAAFEVVNKKAE